MTEEQKVILKLRVMLAQCLGAFEIIQICPDNFNQDGLMYLIEEIKKVLYGE